MSSLQQSKGGGCDRSNLEHGVCRRIIHDSDDLCEVLYAVEDECFKSGSLIDFVALDYEFDDDGIRAMQKLAQVLYSVKKCISVRVSLIDVMAYGSLLQFPAVDTLWIEIERDFVLEGWAELLAGMNVVKLILHAKRSIDISTHVYQIISNSMVAELHVSNGGRGLPHILESCEDNVFLERVFVENARKYGFGWRSVLSSSRNVELFSIEKNLAWKWKYEVRTPSQVKSALEFAVLEAGDGCSSSMVKDLASVVMDFVFDVTE